MPRESRDRGIDPSGEPEAAPAPHTYVLAAPIMRFNLRTEMERLRQLPSYHQGNPTGKTLVKEPDLRIVLMALKAGARLEEHRASGPISVHALEGRLRLRVAEEAVEMTAGELLMLEPNLAHDVDALEDSAFLLTLGRTTYQDVSDQHERRV